MTDKHLPFGNRFLNLKGNSYHLITVIEFHHWGKNRSAYWLCLCDCGTEKVIRGCHLIDNQIKSCGCLMRQTRKTHGMAYSAEWRTWKAMKQRCTNPNTRYFYCYGGRGINVCERWFDSFDDFLADMGRKPSKKHSIERINNDGNYEPGNCKWATAKEQANNTRRNRKKGW